MYKQFVIELMKTIMLLELGNKIAIDSNNLVVYFKKNNKAIIKINEVMEK